jgi:DNA-directed RNA polymerase subunit F
MIITNIRPITDAEAKEILAKKMKNRELNYEQQLAYEYLKNTVKLSKSDSEKLRKELEEFGLKEEKIVNIVNIAPKDEETLKLILKKEKELKPGQIKKILEVVKKY